MKTITLDSCVKTVTEIAEQSNLILDTKELRKRGCLLYLLNKLDFWEDVPVLCELISLENKSKQTGNSDNLLDTLSSIVVKYNEGKPKLDWDNKKQSKYYLYKYKKQDGSWDVDVCYNHDLYCPVTLHFSSKKDALECYNENKELWDEYFHYGKDKINA